MKKQDPIQVLADVLTKMQTRLDNISTVNADNTFEIERLRDANEYLYNQLNEKTAGAEEKVAALSALTHEREERQAFRDQNNVQCLTNLRDSTGKAFLQVKQDVEALMKMIQRLNERVGQVESQNVIATKFLFKKDGFPSDHVWVNKKLTGVYDSVEDLESRIQKMEALLSLYEKLRKAQAAVAEANGAFLSGTV